MTQANLQLASGVVRPVQVDVAIVAVTSGGATKTVTFANVKTIQHIVDVTIVSSANVRRGASGAVTASGNVVTVADGSFANGDTIITTVIGYAS